MGKVRGWTGAKDQKAAARDAAKVQQQATDKALKLSQPFVDLGTTNIPQYQNLLDPTFRYNAVQENPFLQGALDSAAQQTLALGAAGGSANSGGMVNALFNQNFSLLNSLGQQELNNLLTPVSIGQNAAALQGNQLTNNANAQGASLIAQGNTQANMFNNLLTAGAMGAGLFFSDERLKTDVEYLGKDEDGNNVYEYSYKSPERFVGHMAQEVLEKDPGNVLLHPSGYLMVSEKYAPRKVS